MRDVRQIPFKISAGKQLKIWRVITSVWIVHTSCFLSEISKYNKFGEKQILEALLHHSFLINLSYA